MNHLEPACKNSLKFPNRLHVDGVSDPGVYEVRLGARRASFMGPCHETVCASSRQGFTGITPQLATSVTGGIASGFERKRNSVGGSSGPAALARQVPFRIDSVAIHSLAEPVSGVSKNLEIVRSLPSTTATLLNSIPSRDLQRPGIQPIDRLWADPRLGFTCREFRSDIVGHTECAHQFDGNKPVGGRRGNESGSGTLLPTEIGTIRRRPSIFAHR